MTDKQSEGGVGVRHHGGTGDLVKLLRKASRRAESLLEAALATGTGDAVVRLDEASQDLHRALIALES